MGIPREHITNGKVPSTRHRLLRPRRLLQVCPPSLEGLLRILLILHLLPGLAATTSAGQDLFFDKIVVTGGRASVKLSPAETIQFEVQADHNFTPGGSDPGSVERIAVRNIVVKSTEPRNVGTVDEIFATIQRNRDGGGIFESVKIAKPHMTLTGPMLQSILRLVAGKPPATAMDVDTQSSKGWTIRELIIDDAKMGLRGFGDAVPEVRAEFDVHYKDLQFGGKPNMSGTEIVRELVLRNLEMATGFDPDRPFLQIAELRIQFTTEGLARHELYGVSVNGMAFRIGRDFRSMLNARNSASSKPVVENETPPTEPWKIRKFTIEAGRVTLADLGESVPEIQFDAKMQLDNVYLTDDADLADNTLETVELANLTIHSPLDPFVPVANLHSVFIRFSLAGLLSRRIDKVLMLNPTIYIGEDLFWYVDELKKNAAKGTTTGAGNEKDRTAETPDWTIETFEASSGKLVILNGGEAPLTLPIGFSSKAGNIRFANLSELQLELNLLVPQSDYRFPAYQLQFDDFGGDIEFGLPPNTDANNLVQTLRAAVGRWRQYAAHELWLSVTYDREGIYGGFGGAAYRGYVTGAFTFYLQPGSPWSGWVAATDINLSEITRITTPETLSISGRGNLKFEANGMTKIVERVKGELSTSGEGEFHIGKLDELIAKIPPTWTTLKQSLTRIGLETLRDFPYQSGTGDFWYAGDEGEITLGLAGPTGSRNFHVVLHPKE